ncbi:hypothetical protein A6R70_25425 [Agrobacterium rubi]|nr:hypothetical protein [Agrobacterium rubi]
MQSYNDRHLNLSGNRNTVLALFGPIVQTVQDWVRIGILAGSVISGVLGAVLLSVSGRPRSTILK